MKNVKVMIFNKKITSYLVKQTKIRGDFSFIGRILLNLNYLSTVRLFVIVTIYITLQGIFMSFFNKF
jgi:hypothetical protein